MKVRMRKTKNTDASLWTSTKDLEESVRITVLLSCSTNIELSHPLKLKNIIPYLSCFYTDTNQDFWSHQCTTDYSIKIREFDC